MLAVGTRQKIPQAVILVSPGALSTNQKRDDFEHPIIFLPQRLFIGRSRRSGHHISFYDVIAQYDD